MSDLKSTHAGRRPPLGLLAAAALTLAIAALTAILALNAGMPSADTPRYATILPERRSLPDLALLDQGGMPFTRSRFAGEVSLVFFGFTHCPDVCPITLNTLATFKRRVEAETDYRPPNIVFVSVDPARDNPGRIAAYLQAFKAPMTGVAGELAEIEKLAGALGAYHARPETEEGYDVEHSAGVFLVDSDARFAGIVSAPVDAGRLFDDWAHIVAAME